MSLAACHPLGQLSLLEHPEALGLGILLDCPVSSVSPCLSWGCWVNIILTAEPLLPQRCLVFADCGSWDVLGYAGTVELLHVRRSVLEHDHQGVEPTQTLRDWLLYTTKSFTVSSTLPIQCSNSRVNLSQRQVPQTFPSTDGLSAHRHLISEQF